MKYHAVVSADPQVTFTTNVTSVLVGQPFTAKCQVAGYEVKGNEDLVFYIWRKNSTAGDWLINYQYDADGLGKRHWSIGYNRTNHADLAIDLQPNTTYPDCEVSMRPTRLADYEYYCTFTKNTLPRWYFSNHVTVSVHPPPHLTLSSNVTDIQAGQPFSLFCQLEGLEKVVNRNYSVQFRDSDTLLATYNVFAPSSTGHKPQVLFEKTKQDNLSIRFGEHFAYPTFEIILSTQTKLNQFYRCSLLDEGKNEYKSNLWSTPVVAFTANVSTHQNGIPFAGRCSVTKFPSNDTAYSVGFFATQTGLLASYIVRPNKPIDLAIEGHHPNVIVTHGSSFSLPTFELSINLTGSNQAFWCTFKLEQSVGAKEYKSNEVTL